MRIDLYIDDDLQKMVDMLIKRSIELKIHTTSLQLHLVGGALRDHFLRNEQGRKSRSTDFDIATNFHPDQILTLLQGMPNVQSINETGKEYGTIKFKYSNINQIEITTFRSEGDYVGRNPTEVEFVTTVEEDMCRRDFTINSMAYNLITKELTDECLGMKDLLYDQTLVVNGNANQKMLEDPLRILRAIRFATTLDLKLDPELKQALLQNSAAVQTLSIERIRDEINKLLIHHKAHRGIRMMQTYGILQYVFPCLSRLEGFEQNRYHTYDVFEHTLLVLKNSFAISNSSPVRRLELSLACLYHDIGKFNARTRKESTGEFTFIGHEDLSAKECVEDMKRMKYSNVEIDWVQLLVANHGLDIAAIRHPHKYAKELFLAFHKQPCMFYTFMVLLESDLFAGKTFLSDKILPFHNAKLIMLNIINTGQNTEVFTRNDLRINGKDINQHLPEIKGSDVGSILADLTHNAFHRNVINEKYALLKSAKFIYDKMLIGRRDKQNSEPDYYKEFTKELKAPGEKDV